MKTLLFPGWASFESFYKKEIKEEFFYMEHYNKYDEKEEVNIIAWSMGTLKALEFIKTHKVNKLILMAPTRDFTETTDEKSVNLMIEGLKKNKIITLKNFYKMSFNDMEIFREFWNEYENEIRNLSEEKLIEELKILRDTKIENIDFQNVKKVYVFYGQKDKIIPVNDIFLKVGKNTEYLRGHNFIYKNEELKELVRSLLND